MEVSTSVGVGVQIDVLFAVMSSHDLYLGMLYPSEEYRVYGYVTATLVKLIIVVDAEVSDQAMKNVKYLSCR